MSELYHELVTKIYMQSPIYNFVGDIDRRYDIYKNNKFFRYVSLIGMDKIIDFKHLDVVIDIVNVLKSGVWVMYPISIYNIHLGYAMSRMDKKGFKIINFYKVIGFQPSLLYRQGVDYNYNDITYLVEGIRDAEVLSKILQENGLLQHSMVISYMNAKASINLLKVISYYTTKVVIIADNDESGERGKSFMNTHFNRLHVNDYYISLDTVKDVADIDDNNLYGTYVYTNFVSNLRSFRSI